MKRPVRASPSLAQTLSAPQSPKRQDTHPPHLSSQHPNTRRRSHLARTPCQLVITSHARRHPYHSSRREPKPAPQHLDCARRRRRLPELLTHADATPPAPLRVVDRVPALPLATGVVTARPTARTAATPPGVGQTDRKGTCPHPEPGSPPPPATPRPSSERSTRGRHPPAYAGAPPCSPPAGAVEMPPSRRAAGKEESVGLVTCTNLQSESQHWPVDETFLHSAAL